MPEHAQENDGYESPYGYMIEHGLALGILSPQQVRAMGLNPAHFAPDLYQVKPDLYKGLMLPKPQKPPYDPADPVIAALARGFDQNHVTYRQIDLLGLHPYYIPGAQGVIARRKGSVWKNGSGRR